MNDFRRKQFPKEILSDGNYYTVAGASCQSKKWFFLTCHRIAPKQVARQTQPRYNTKKTKGEKTLDLTNFTERPWGAYRDLAVRAFPGNENTLVKEIFVPAGKCMSVQKHNLRVVGAGKGQFYFEGETRDVGPGDVLVIPRGKIHCVRSAPDTDLYFIELQCGETLTGEDIERFETEW